MPCFTPKVPFYLKDKCFRKKKGGFVLDFHVPKRKKPFCGKILGFIENFDLTL